MSVVTDVQVQGRQNSLDHFVKSYRVEYSANCEIFTPVLDANGKSMVCAFLILSSGQVLYNGLHIVFLNMSIWNRHQKCYLVLRSLSTWSCWIALCFGFMSIIKYLFVRLLLISFVYWCTFITKIKNMCCLFDSQTFQGLITNDGVQVVTTSLSVPVVANCLRIYPLTWHFTGSPCLRAEVLGYSLGA